MKPDKEMQDRYQRRQDGTNHPYMFDAYHLWKWGWGTLVAGGMGPSSPMPQTEEEIVEMTDKKYRVFWRGWNWKWIFWWEEFRYNQVLWHRLYFGPVEVRRYAER